MLILRAMGPGQGLISNSPFSMKAMGYLHLLGFNWQLDTRADVRKQPAGKLPVLVDGDQVIPDSGAIARHLEAKAGRGLNDGLSEADKRLSHALLRMFEEHLYFIVVHNRWSEDANFAGLRPQLEKLAPFPMSKLLPGIIRKSVLKQVAAQGVGRMPDSERALRLAADLDAAQGQLGGQKYQFGDAPTAADMSLAPMLAVLVACKADTAVRRALDARPRLTEYTARAMNEAFPAHDALPFSPRA